MASYKVGPNSRKGLLTNLEFASAFCSAKERIRRMHYRYVEETDQTRQWLLEAYCTLVLEARYNDFDTH